VLPDSAIIEAAATNPAGRAELLTLPVFRGRAQRRMVDVWAGALRKANGLPRHELPDSAPSGDGPPPPNRWAERDPAAAARLTAARAALAKIATDNRLPVENLLLPDLVRRTCWQPPADTRIEAVADTLRAGGAREWQLQLTAAPLSIALAAAPQD
jgi:ribonuclease D